MPIHVHVKKGGNESTFELIMQDKILVEIRERTSNLHTPLTPAETKMALEFIQKYSQNIINKWINCFVWNKPVRSTKITKKI